MTDPVGVATAEAQDFPRWSAAATHQPTPWDVLNYAHGQILDGDFLNGLSTLYVGLYGHRREMPREEWFQFCDKVRREHALTQIIHQSPLARRAFEKPRGYAGDAVLIDLLYRYGPLPPGVTDIGRQVLAWELQAAGPRSARNRRSYLASIIDFVSTLRDGVRVFSIACGHLREIELSMVARTGRIGEFMALDQDPESLAEVSRVYGKWVTPVRGSVRQLLTTPNDYRDFDLVYASGLYDYLPQETGAALLGVMWKMLRPGGRVLVANWASDVLDPGYVETFMDWRLVYRDEQQVEALAAVIERAEVASMRLFRDPGEGCIFLELVRR